MNGVNPSLEYERPLRVAYMMSRFPKITETFILCEILAVRELGVEVEIFPLQKEHAQVQHPEAAALVDGAHFASWLSWRIIKANVKFAVSKPLAYVSTAAVLLSSNLGSLRYFSGAAAFFPKTVYFAEKMKKLRIDHLHAHFASHPAAMAYVIGKLTGIPFSFTAHGSDLHRDRHMLREKTDAAAFVVAISDYNRRMILDECGNQHAEKVVVLHCGVDRSLFAEQIRLEQDTGRSSLKITCIGTLHEVKGQSYLIEACRRLRDRSVEFTLHLIGDGPDRTALERQAGESSLTQHIEFHGAITRTEVARILADTDIIAAPSVPTTDGRREGIPVALMEAMAGGVPAVASRLSGIPELVEHEKTGLLAPPRDVDALAEALNRLAVDVSFRRRLGNAAREKVKTEFDLHQNAEQLVAHFRASAEHAPLLGGHDGAPLSMEASL